MPACKSAVGVNLLMTILGLGLMDVETDGSRIAGSISRACARIIGRFMIVSPPL